MSLKKIASLTALISFILEIVTSVVLYIVPHGRVAYWSDWRFLGLSKTQWTEQHINLGVLFLIAIIVHTWYNWPVITSYLKRARNLKVFTGAFNTALLLSILFCLGTYFEVVPLSTVIEISNSIKDKGGEAYGEPPYGHAELSTLKTFAKKTEIDLETGLVKLKEAGIRIENTEQTLAEIAKANRTTPKQIYEIIKPVPAESSHGLPATPPGGIGRRTLSELCDEYDIDCGEFRTYLAERGFDASADSTIKEIGSTYNRNPHDIYEMLAERFKESD